MEIHKPKPVNGWRELLSEIVVIVIGVSIALAAEQLVETLHWRAQVQGAHEALAGDMATVLGMAAEREGFSSCLDEHLNHLADDIDEASRTGRLPPQGAMHRAPRRLWRLNSWDGLVAAGIGPHLPRDELLKISQMAFYLSLAEQADVDENVQWTRLYAMVGPGRAAESGELNDLRAALSAARGDAKSLRLATAQIARAIESTQIVSKDEEQRAKDAYLSGPNQARCIPDEPVPARYGDGPPAGLPLAAPSGQ
jgi:hypothetical protein